VKHLLWYLLAGTRGGETRIRLLQVIRRRPINAHQLAAQLKLDYKTVEHHLIVLVDNRLLQKHGGYGAVYFVTPELESEMSTFEEIAGSYTR
jgi:DNA-binding transcriptional ArsR family regulator